MEAVHPLVEARQRLGKSRDGKAISQDELGALVGVDGMTVSRWERRENVPRAKYLPKLVELAEKPAAEIIAACMPPTSVAAE